MNIYQSIVSQMTFRMEVDARRLESLVTSNRFSINKKHEKIHHAMPCVTED